MPALIIVGLGYGDEGKGAVVDHLAREHNAGGVVFTNGGRQRAHNVVLPDGRSHTFSQFSSGTFAGAKTYHSRHSMVSPHALFIEWELLRQKGIWPADQIAVHEQSLITTPFHIAMNRLRSETLAHGTCGVGIGETVTFERDNPAWALRAIDLRNLTTTRAKLVEIQQRLRIEALTMGPDVNSTEFQKLCNPQEINDATEIYRIFAKSVPLYDDSMQFDDETIIFEGSQGVLLDQFHGFHPHTTWSKTTNENALRLLSEQGFAGYKGQVRTIGVMRSYMTRHGAGPFVTEDPELHERFPEAHNGSEGWQGSWRVGWTDLRAMRYSLACMDGTVDELAVTHLDRVQGDWKVCVGYNRIQNEPHVPIYTDRKIWEDDRARVLANLAAAQPLYVEFEDMRPADLLEVIEAQLDLPVTIEGSGATAYMSEAVAI